MEQLTILPDYCCFLFDPFYNGFSFDYSDMSWKRPDTGERVSGLVDREEVFRATENSRLESEPDFPKPAEGRG